MRRSKYCAVVIELVQIGQPNSNCSLGSEGNMIPEVATMLYTNGGKQFLRPAKD